MSSTSSTPRDEVNRSRRRRRRGASSAGRGDDRLSSPHHFRRPYAASTSNSRYGRKSTSDTGSQSTAYYKSERDRPRDRRASPTSSYRPNGEAIPQDVGRGTRLTFDGSSRERDTREREVREKEALEKEAREKEALEKEVHEKEAREREAREKEAHEKEARDEEQRLAQLAEQLAKREEERSRNLPFCPSRIGEDTAQQRPSDAELRQLDSSLKKCTGFLRKVRTSGINEESISSLSAESYSLNLSRYISEVVSAMAESRLRSADVPYFITLAGQLHRRYEDFLPQLITALTNIVIPSSSASKDLPSRKASMRLLAEMYILSMYADVNHITNLLRHLMRPSRDVKDEQLNNLSIISSFVRAGARSLIPRNADSGSFSPSMQVPEEEKPTVNAINSTWEDNVALPSVKSSILSALQSYFETEVDRLVKDAINNLRITGEAAARAKQVRDSSDEATAIAFDNAKQFCDKAIAAGNVIADALDKSLFVIPTEAPGTGEIAIQADPAQVFVANSFSYISKNRNATHDLDVMQNADHPFETDEQRMFYTELIEVESLVGVKGTSEKKGDGNKSTTPSHRGDGRKRGSDKPPVVEKLLSKLPIIETKDAADSFVQQFVLAKEGSRSGTKRLARILFTVSPQKINVLPAYSRIAANLQPLYNGDIGGLISTWLEEDFRSHAGKADLDERNLALCIKCSQYIGEYVKFGLISISLMFDLLSLCMKDLSGHRIDSVCHLLESCGRYVYRTSSSHARMCNILDTLWRVKSVRNLEARHNTLIENAFYAVRLSPGSKAQKVKSRPPIHEYIRHLIYHRLDAANITWTRNQLLKLPWNDELEFYVIKKFVKISRARYSTIPYVALLISALQKHKSALVIGITDALLECIRSGMEKNDGRDSQRRLAEVNLLGELYKCNVVDENLIYNVLYLIITLGHEESPDDLPTNRKPFIPGLSLDSDSTADEGASVRSINGAAAVAPDPPGDFFRIRLACVLIEACGRSLVRSNCRRFEVYLVFLERYLFCKTYQAGLGDRIPLHINHIIDDVLDGIVVGGNRRYMKDVHSSTREVRNENSRLQGNIADGDWQPSFGRQFTRSRTFEEALKAVNRIEQSTADTALISVPVRHMQQTSRTAIELDSNELNGSLESNKPVESESRGRSPSQTVAGENDVKCAREYGGDDITSDGLETGEDEDSTVIEGEDDLSGDDETLDDDDDYDVDIDESVDDPEHDGEHHDEEDDDDSSDDDDNDDDDDDDSVVVSDKRPKLRTEEEDAFARELAAFTAEEVQNARATNSRITRFDRMAIPMSLIAKKQEEERAAAAAHALNPLLDSDSSEDLMDGRRCKFRTENDKAVEFKVLLRKGGKSQLQDLKVPATSSIAVAAKESETANAARHEETKRLVLGSSVVQNEDEYDFEEDVPLQAEQEARAKEESIRQQRCADEHELLATLFRNKPRR